MTEREELECIFSDVHKDACGFRPRMDTSDWSLDDLRAEIADLHRWGWETAYDRAYRDANDASPDWAAIRRMNVAELVHRTTELESAEDAIPTRGIGWALVAE